MSHRFRIARPAAIGSLALLGLAGCSSASAGTGASAPAGGVDASSLKDGSYSAVGDYQSPGGASAVEVDLTLKHGTVTALKVVPKAENATAAQYEAQFAAGVNALAVGKKITDLNVTTVSGSSLTSQGFQAAVAAIEQQAR